TKFIWEGHECGGHIGPLSSFVLWELQIHRLESYDEPEKLAVYFAGGIHDDLSAAMVWVLASGLVKRGAAVGFLVGTGYLFTREAVASGAIMKGYQDLMVASDRTVTLESAKGQVTRAVQNDFTDHFESYKEKLEKTHTDAQAISAELELLNLGRLRIAAKGIRRDRDRQVNLNDDEQKREGLYMAGQMVALRDKVTDINTLHHDIAVKSGKFIEENLRGYQIEKKGVSLADDRKIVDVAIIGIACIYPESKNIDEYWQNIISGRNAISEVPEERWNIQTYFDPDAESKAGGEKSISKWGGFIPDIEIDPLAFGIPPKTMTAIDPMQILSLMVAKNALEDAGYWNRNFDRDFTAVIFGAGSGSDLPGIYGLRCWYPTFFGPLPRELDERLPPISEDTLPGILSNVVAGRITNRFDLGGTNCTIDAACGSSLAALNLAVKELTLGTANMVLCGGADLHNSVADYIMFSGVKALTKKERCSPFDSQADGTILGEGISCVVLKRFEDAKRDKDRIYAVIKGLGCASDGRHLGIAAPRKDGQKRSLERSYKMAGVSPASVGLVEAHGTGTVAGDNIELSCLNEIFSEAGAKRGACVVGSVKSQIGHTKCAAGMAGLIKVAKSLYHGVLPPSINIKSPNQVYQQEVSPFSFSDMSKPWSSAEKYGGVSAFGFGGTNFHAVLTQDDEFKGMERTFNEWSYELIL
ncbi:MAG: erythronolide synthase, partial [Oligoflexales bacterium]|nr:erythronolide synthase [Oligoflexales bacterium]